MELLSNSLRELQKRNELLSNENKKLKSKMNLIKEMNETLNGIRNHLENTIKIISIQINSIDSMIPTNIENELKKLRNNYEKLKQSLDKTETQIICVNQSEEQVINNNITVEQLINNSNNNIIISNITGNSINNTINTTIDDENTSNINNLMENPIQNMERVENVSPNIAIKERNVREESDINEERDEVLLMDIKTESEYEIQYVCEQQNCGLKFNNAFRLSVHRRTHLMRQQMRHKCPNSKCNFMTNKKSNYTKHMTICQKTIFKCDSYGCEEFFTKIIELRRHKKQSHNLNTTQLTPIQVNENVNNNNIGNNQTKDNKVEALVRKRVTKYRRQPKNSKLKRNVYGNYECYYANCGRIFKEKIRLIYHLRTHTDERPHKCHFEGCDKGFKTPGQLQNHINVHTGVKPYKCDGICGQICEYATLSQLHHHRKRYHSGIKPFKCDYELFDCKESFISIREMKAHRNIVHYNKRPKTIAEKCIEQNGVLLNKPRRSAFRKLITVNRNIDKQIDLTPLQIPPLQLSPIIQLSPLHIREQQNSQLNQIQNTVNRIDNKEKLLFNCDCFGCDQSFKTAIELVRHNMKHIQIEPIVTLDENVNDIPVSTTSSPNASINTTFNSSLNTSVYTSFNTSTCSTRESSLSSSNSSSSATKSKRVTAPKGSFGCRQCDIQFDFKSQYMIHLRKHEKPFHCLFDGCGKQFKNKEQLTVHTRTHTGEKPFVCTFIDCGKGFKTTCQLNQHMILHTGVKLYKCQLYHCQKDFATHSQLIHHRNKYHPQITSQTFN